MLRRSPLPTICAARSGGRCGSGTGYPGSGGHSRTAIESSLAGLISRAVEDRKELTHPRTIPATPIVDSTDFEACRAAVPVRQYLAAAADIVRKEEVIPDRQASPQWREPERTDLRLPAPTNVNLPAMPVPSSPERSTAMEKIKLTFIHPTESDRRLTAAVPPDATAKQVISEMIKANFISAPTGEGVQYRLRNAETNQQLLDNTTLTAAGVTSGATLMVDHTTTGAKQG